MTPRAIGSLLIIGAVLVGFSLASWLITIPYVAAFSLIVWLERHAAHPALVVPFVVVCWFFALVAVGHRRRMRATGSERGSQSR